MNFKPDFTFKRFAISHQNCAMKVNTDGILLACWVKLKHEKNILDIGTGTGLIALMLAQRTESNQANIHAVEIENDAFAEAKINVLHSPWSDRVVIHHSDIRDWSPSQHFDLIVSNPPYFNNSLLSEKKTKNLARHTNELSFSALLLAVSQLAQPHTEFNLILPSPEAKQFIELATQCNWYPSHITHVQTVCNKSASRQLMCLSQVKKTLVEDTISIRNTDNQYTADFIALTKDFYLFM